MSKLTIYHGSEYIIKKPTLTAGKKYNDYGQGFYCTEEIELAKEWACKNQTDGFINSYELNLNDLRVLYLNKEGHTVLNWISILLQNRVFRLDSDIAKAARDYLIQHFSIDISQYDVVIGYRADDSYFSFAESFVSNTLPLRSLNKALCLGELGEQVALVSEKAFQKLIYLESTPVDKAIYYPKFISRDYDARVAYKKMISSSNSIIDDIFVLDIIRQEMKNNDPRLQ